MLLKIFFSLEILSVRYWNCCLVREKNLSAVPDHPGRNMQNWWRWGLWWLKAQADAHPRWAVALTTCWPGSEWNLSLMPSVRRPGQRKTCSSGELVGSTGQVTGGEGCMEGRWGAGGNQGGMKGTANARSVCWRPSHCPAGIGHCFFDGRLWENQILKGIAQPALFPFFCSWPLPPRYWVPVGSPLFWVFPVMPWLGPTPGSKGAGGLCFANEEARTFCGTVICPRPHRKEHPFLF